MSRDVNADFVLDVDRLDPETLRAAAKTLDRDNHAILRENIALKQRVRELEGKEPMQLEMQLAELERQLAARNRALFGDKSEKRGRAKKGHDEQSESSRGHGPREQPELPVIERTLTLDDADRVCTSCGGELNEWEGQTEDSEEIDAFERRFVRVIYKRKKYRCRCGGCIETAPGPQKLIAGGRYAPDFAAQVAVSKYADHLPLERQVRIMKRHGLVIDSQTLWDQIDALARYFEDAYERLHAYVLTKPVLGADETPWRLLGHNGTKSKRWYAWALAADDAVVYRIDESRSAEAAEKILRDFAGTLLVDGYTAYEGLRKRGALFRIAHCWAHVRRKFIEAHDTHAKECAEVLDMIGALYGVERELGTGPPDKRLAVRHERARPIVQSIHRWALDQRALPQSPLGKAIGYLGSMWPGLQVFLEDPNVSLDNNAVERSLRAVVVGRKNHYGSRSKRGTEVAALFYSLVESAHRADKDPYRYLQRGVRAALNGEPVPLPHELPRDDS